MKYLSILEAAEYARCPETAIRAAIADGSLTHARFSKASVSIDIDDLVTWIEARKVSQEADNAKPDAG